MPVNVNTMIVKKLSLLDLIKELYVLVFCYFIIFLFLLFIDYNDFDSFFDRKILVGLLVLASFLPFIFIEHGSTNYRKINKLDIVLYYMVSKCFAVSLSLNIVRGVHLLYPLPVFTFLNFRSIMYLNLFIAISVLAIKIIYNSKPFQR
jgi:hypothetical protein